MDVVEVAAGREAEVRPAEFEPLRKLKTFGGETGKPFEDALADLAASEVAEGTYVRLNVLIKAGELAGADWAERARKVASDKGLRFCYLKSISQEAEEKGEKEKFVLSVDELKELSSDSVVDILAQKHPLTDRQRQLLKGLLEEIENED